MQLLSLAQDIPSPRSHPPPPPQTQRLYFVASETSDSGVPLEVYSVYTAFGCLKVPEICPDPASGGRRRGWARGW